MFFRKRNPSPPPILHAEDHDFDAVIDRAGVVVVDFWAPWCAPCRMMAPILDDIAIEYADRPLAVVKVNTDRAPASAERFGIRSIPTLVFFKDGEPRFEMVGLVPQPVLRREVEGLLAPAASADEEATGDADLEVS